MLWFGEPWYSVVLVGIVWRSKLWCGAVECCVVWSDMYGV